MCHEDGRQYMNMKISPRYPFPKSLPSGKGLAIAPLKVYLLFVCFPYVSRGGRSYMNMKICPRYPFPKSLLSGKGLAIAPLKVYLLFVCFPYVSRGRKHDTLCHYFAKYSFFI